MFLDYERWPATARRRRGEGGGKGLTPDFECQPEESGLFLKALGASGYLRKLPGQSVGRWAEGRDYTVALDGG